MGGCRLDPKISRRELFQRILALGIFGAWWVAMTPLHWLLLCLRVIVILPGFGHGQKSQQELICIAPKKFQNFFRRLLPLAFLIRVQAFWDAICGELPHVQIFMNDRPNPVTWNAQLSSYWFSWNPGSSKLSSRIWSIISGVVAVLGRSGRGATQVGKSPRLNWFIKFLTVTYDGTCSPNVSVIMPWISFGTLPCRKRIDDCSHLHVV